MIIKQINRDDAVEMYVVGQNAAGEVLSNGVMVCWDWRNASSLGNAVAKPATSNLGLFAGVLAHKAPNYADLPANSFGKIQVLGVHGSVAYNVGAASVSCAGQWLIPVNAQYSGQTNQISAAIFGFTSNVHMIARGAFLMQNDLSATGWGKAFVRAL